MPATFITDNAAARFASRIDTKRRPKVVPHFCRGCLEGYRVILGGRALTEAEVEAMA